MATHLFKHTPEFSKIVEISSKILKRLGYLMLSIILSATNWLRIDTFRYEGLLNFGAEIELFVLWFEEF